MPPFAPPRPRVRRLAVALAWAALTLLSACSTQPSRPNVILILTDDQLAASLALMPTLQRELVGEGVHLPNAFTSTPLCCPARVSLLRGQYAHNHRVRSNGGPEGGFPKLYDTGAEASSLATWLQGAGYRTALMGKYLNAYPYGPEGENPSGYRGPRVNYVPPGWSEWYGFIDVPRDPRNSPYAMYDYKINANGRIRHYGSRPQDYQTDVLAGLAVDFVRRSARRGPFFLLLAPTAPHLPAVPAPRHADAFRDLQAPRPPSFNADPQGKARWLELPPLSDADIAAIDATYRAQAQMLLAVDELLGSLLDALRETGTLDNTYLVFTSDHGWHSGEHRLFHLKLTPYDASVRLPLVIRGPGIPKGEVREHLVLNTDLAPTIAAWAGVSPPAWVDGRSLAPVLRPRPVPLEGWRQSVLTEFWPRRALGEDPEHRPTEHHPKVPVPQYRAVRTLGRLYVEYRYADGTREGELYDLTNDPFELTNLYAGADVALKAALAAHAEALQGCAGATCRALEDQAVP
ncbi:sulfatase family protein [Truepera radiovictrix]|uniref:sulfatase family protein n=1 Tax=Truepera radiovictrix TaxID=332249 RepID=UPI0003025194|nr:sulfatase [Truepera radiovictrix]WMT57060.1 sulfatase [Truepera radiovictrix]